MSLADYLAKNYLTADKPNGDKKSKKRKRKGTAAAPDAGLVIADDDEAGWGQSKMDLDEDDRPVTVVGHSGTTSSSRLKKSNWKTVGSAAPTNSEQATADAIIAATAAENAASSNPADDAPTLDDVSAARMESGAFAGLQTAAQVDAAIKHKQAAEQAAYDEANAGRSGKESETIYRDASGRVVNVAMKRAEARAIAAQQEKTKAMELEAAKGDVQRAEALQRREALQDAKYMTVARYADDAALNDMQKDQDRWNDPAAGFLVKKKAGKSVTGKPLYKGSAAPNRYGIRPGYRWDGVDRSNGFEKEYFQARAKRKNRAELEFAWQMDE